MIKEADILRETVPRRPRHLRRGLAVAGATFLTLLIAMQFLPGGRRSVSDGLLPLLFLLGVSLATTTIILGIGGLVRGFCCLRLSTQLLLGCAGMMTGAALYWGVEIWRGWHAWKGLAGQGELKSEPLDLAPILPKVQWSVTNAVRIRVDATDIVRSVDARLFGMNTAIWDGDLDTPETTLALRELDVQALRFPGGSLSDEYHWASNTLGTNGRACPTSFSNFVHVATNLQAQVFITVNYGSGTPEEAAAWVRCANITNQCGFKYWEIGNENYGDWERDENGRPHDPVTYALRAREYFKQMKAADPAIKIGVVVTTSFKERAGVLLDALKRGDFSTFVRQGYQGWTPKMLATLQQVGVTPDWLSLHRYPQNLSGVENDARLLQSTARWTADAAALRRQLKTYFGAAHTAVELLCTENNSISQNTGKQTTSLVNGLYLADSFGQIAQTEFNAWLWWDFRNVQDRQSNNRSSLYGWRPYGDHGIMSGHDTRYPTFYTFKLLKYFARGGDRMVRATCEGKLLSVYAARRASSTLALLVINKSPQATLAAGFSIAGFRPAPHAIVYSYGIPQDEAERTGTGPLDIAQETIAGAAVEFSRNFPPYSATVLVLSQEGPESTDGAGARAAAHAPFSRKATGREGQRSLR